MAALLRSSWQGTRFPPSEFAAPIAGFRVSDAPDGVAARLVIALKPYLF
jgi:hypothetical protein